jgi:hypothetical protein
MPKPVMLNPWIVGGRFCFVWLGLAVTALAQPAVVAAPAGGTSAASGPAANTSVIPADLTAFDEGLGHAVAARLSASDKHWRQISPAVHHLALQQAQPLAAMNDDERLAALTELSKLIDAKRSSVGMTPVLANGRSVIGLLDPAHGLGRKEITAIADAYGCDSTVYKKNGDSDTIDGIAERFLEAVTAAIGSGKPTSVIVLGHGLPTEIQSYHIRFERLAKALVDGGADGDRAGQGQKSRNGRLDLSQVVLICDDCFSADFHINLLGELEREAGRRGLTLVSLPVCIAGTNRDCVGHADVGEKFVPHFWRDVIELYFIRRPLPEAVTLADFFEKVDNMMYGYGRAPIVEGGRVAGYRLVDPEMVQDPVVFVPLDTADIKRLREILGLSADSPLPRWLDVG